MTNRKDRVLAFLIWPILAILLALAILQGCATTRAAETALISQPPKHLQGDITTLVEWKSSEDVAFRCASLQAAFGKLPVGGLGCTFAPKGGGPVTIVLPRDLHPLVIHEIAHAIQLLNGEQPNHDGFTRSEPVDHKGFR